MAATYASMSGTSGSVFVTVNKGTPSTSVSTTTCNTMDAALDPGALSRNGRSTLPVMRSNMT